MQLYKPGIAWPNADNNPWPIMEEASDEGEYYYKEDVHDQLTQLRGNLSLAEEGLANYAQEVERLKAHMRNVAGWLNNGCEPAKGAAELLLIAGLPPPQSAEHAQQK